MEIHTELLERLAHLDRDLGKLAIMVDVHMPTLLLFRKLIACLRAYVSAVRDMELDKHTPTTPKKGQTPP